jgi:hypothetical protein
MSHQEYGVPIKDPARRFKGMTGCMRKLYFLQQPNQNHSLIQDLEI